MKQFKVAIVGCGNVAQMHFEAYTPHSDRIRLVAACDPEFELVEQAQKKYGIEQGFASVEDMIAGADWDVGVVCTPTPVREKVVQQLSGAGKQIYVEKPFADTFDEAQRMVDLCSAADVMLAVNQNFRFHYPFDIARSVIHEGRIGEVTSVTHQNLQFRQDSGWRTQAARHSLSIMGVHWLDGFRWMLDDVARSIVGETRTSSAIDAAGETDTAFQLIFDRGTMVSYVESFSCAFRKTETIVLGNRGTLRFDYAGLDCFDLGAREQPAERWESPYPKERKPGATFQGLDLLLTAIEEGVEPANSGRDNLKTIALLEGAYRAADDHSKVSL